MISLQTKTSTSSSPLNTAPPSEDTPTLSFSQLLKGVSEAKDTKVMQNGALLLSLDTDTQDTKIVKSSKEPQLDTLMSLLKGNDIAEEDIEPLALPTQELVKMTPSELKTVISDAKNYLKEKIVAIEGFQKEEIQALPKTLKGLVQLAQKIGVDISKVTLEEVRTTSKTQVVLEVDKQGVITQDEKTLKPIPKTQKVVEQEVAQKIEQSRVETKIKELPKELKMQPLFKAQASNEFTTQQLVSAKLTTTIEIKTPKEKADTTLEMLLRGTKTSKSEKGFTADFSVATTRVIAPQATTPSSEKLESLLRGETKPEESSSKIDGLNVSKADSFEVKLNEAKQMIKYLSNDVKTAIEDYKSPFTRIKVQLNPQKLGEVDLTIVQRGKNLHINLSSNSAAINTLSINANELKTQLNNSGINNASLNFNNNSQSSEQNFSGQQQQNSQNEKDASAEYNYFNNEEKNEEILSSLEIVVPNYA